MSPAATEPSEPVQKRRKFIQILLGGGAIATAASFFYPVLKYLAPPQDTDMGSDTVIAGKVGDLKPNSGKIFPFGSRPALLIMDAAGSYRALSAVCTHLGCTVQYRGETHQVWCACHNGTYDLNGRNVSGPPPRPLEAYDVHVRGDQIFVSRKREA
jgi:Rieske Fe-S protein